jgi:hypothetical protein
VKYLAFCGETQEVLPVSITESKASTLKLINEKFLKRSEAVVELRFMGEYCDSYWNVSKLEFTSSERQIT